MNIMMFAHGGSLNRGCEAIVRSSAAMIKQEIPGAKVYLVSQKPETDRNIFQLDQVYNGSKCSMKKYSFEWFLSLIHLKFFRTESYALRKIENNTIKHIEGMDICLSIGGDNYCYGEQPGWYEIDKVVKKQGKKLVLWGCSIGEEDLSDNKLADLRLFDLILVRESLTYNNLKKAGLKAVSLCADPAFTLGKEELDLPVGWQEGNTLGFNFSPLVLGRNPNLLEALRNLINHILQTTPMTIALTPHVIEEGNNDYDVLYPFYKEFEHTGRVIILSSHLNALQYKGYIARMRFFIGARTHATIAAYSSCIPTMVMGYSVKSKGIAMDLFGTEKLVLRVEEISEENKLIEYFNEMLKQEKEIRSRLQQVLPEIQKRSHYAVECLIDITR